MKKRKKGERLKINKNEVIGFHATEVQRKKTQSLHHHSQKEDPPPPPTNLKINKKEELFAFMFYDADYYRIIVN